MLQALCRKGLLCFTVLLLIVTCTSCKTEEPYTKSEYLCDLAHRTGISENKDIDTVFEDLLSWNVIYESDREHLNERVDYSFLSGTISNILEEDNTNSILLLKDHGWITNKVDESDYVDKKTAEDILFKFVDYLNNRQYEKEYYIEEKENVAKLDDYYLYNNLLTSEEELNNGDIVFLENDGIYKKVVNIEDGRCILDDVSYDDVFSMMNIADSFEVDFDNAEVIPYGTIEETNYQNTSFNLLASKNSVFNIEGFRVSFNVLSSGIDVHVSKSVNNLNIYTDLKISRIKPTFKWRYEKGDLKNCFFKIDFDTCEEFGVSSGKYQSFYVDFKDLDSKSFLKKLRSRVNASEDYAEATIPICQIKTPIPNVPYVFLNMDLLLRIYVSGKAELVLTNSHEVGFETRDGKIRFISEHTNDYDLIAKASSKATAGVAFGMEAAGFRLFDVELDAGLGFTVQSILHLYDEDGNDETVESDISYAAIEEISKENNDVRLCADVSFHWVMDLQINTSRTVLSKLGLSKKISFLDENDTVFNNLHHIENGRFVEKCSRKSRAKIIQSSETIDSSKIVLERYSAVIKLGNSYKINVKAVPEGYSQSSLLYSSSDDSVASVNNGVITANSKGSTKIRVYTSDNKYEAYINVLASDS